MRPAPRTPGVPRGPLVSAQECVKCGEGRLATAADALSLVSYWQGTKRARR